MFGKPPWTLHGIFRWKNSMHQGGSSSTTSPTILEKHRDPGDPTTMWVNVDVSENSGFSPQIIHGLIGFSTINHPFWDTTIFGNTHVELHQKSLDKKTNMHIPAMMITNDWKYNTEMNHQKGNMAGSRFSIARIFVFVDFVLRKETNRITFYLFEMSILPLPSMGLVYYNHIEV